MAARVKSGTAKGANKRSTNPSKSGSSSRIKKQSSAKSAVKTTQHKPKPSIALPKKKPPHLRYKEKELGVPQLNGIRPVGVQKLPNKKKGKQFVDDGEGMRTILAMVMAEKEGNIESKMMRARQMEEIREAKRAEAEKRAENKKAGLEQRKEEIKHKNRRPRHADGDRKAGVNSKEGSEGIVKKVKKRVSFG